MAVSNKKNVTKMEDLLKNIQKQNDEKSEVIPEKNTDKKYGL